VFHEREEMRLARTDIRTLVALAWLVGCAPAAWAQTPRPSFPVTLPEAVQYAIDNYPAIRASMARLSAQESGVDLTRTSYLPRLRSGTSARATTWCAAEMTRSVQVRQ
jgi:outer membrane protein TolC